MFGCVQTRARRTSRARVQARDDRDTFDVCSLRKHATNVVHETGVNLENSLNSTAIHLDCRLATNCSSFYGTFWTAVTSSVATAAYEQSRHTARLTSPVTDNHRQTVTITAGSALTNFKEISYVRGEHRPALLHSRRRDRRNCLWVSSGQPPHAMCQPGHLDRCSLLSDPAFGPEAPSRALCNA